MLGGRDIAVGLGTFCTNWFGTRAVFGSSIRIKISAIGGSELVVNGIAFLSRNSLTVAFRNAR